MPSHIYCKAKTVITGLTLAVLSLLANHVFAQTVAEKNSGDSIIHLADPSIFNDGAAYYLYGTTEGKTGNGFLVYTSKDLAKWSLPATNEGYALKKGDVYGTKGFWAPQVFAFHNKFYMAYVANENIAFAQATSPAGPFTQLVKDSLPATVKQIDPFVFMDDDGKKYLFHVRLTNGNRIFVAEMNDDLTALIPGTLHECIAATEPWENTANAPWPVAEGPAVLKHDGIYYLVYSANDFRNPGYAVGYATSNSPLGPWKKFEGNPVISKKITGINGPGHGDFFKSGNELYYVLHTHNSNSGVSPRKTAIIKFKFIANESGPALLTADQESFHFLPGN